MPQTPTCDDVERSDEDVAGRGLLAREPAHQLERRALERGGELLLAADRSSSFYQRASASCAYLRERNSET
ncbi:MAG TPA: hypothetical protein VFJ70_14635 [Burkholderiales bacterium]|nr:hypothetical protein [Burkholderiales bacterium]